MSIGSCWARRLASMAPLSAEDEGILSALMSGDRQRAAGRDFAESRDAGQHVVVMVSGLACKSKLLADGRRQILSYLFPGDMTSPDRLLAPRPELGISMLIPSEIVVLDRADMESLRKRPNIAVAFGRYALIKEAITAEWQINVGIRTAEERISHLLCEMYSRLHTVGLSGNNIFRLPLTQLQLADSTALSAVHVNRVMMALRRRKLLAISHGVVTILDHAELCRVAGFDSSYLGKDEEQPAVHPSAISGIALHERRQRV